MTEVFSKERVRRKAYQGMISGFFVSLFDYEFILPASEIQTKGNYYIKQ